MSSKITFGTSIVNNSITNSNATTTIDNTQPLSFLEFIRNTNVDYTPDEYNNFYLFYLKQWADIINSKNGNSSVNFTDLYVNFLKNLILTYSTQQELKFMSTLDFNDPVDLDIAIPIYVEKIRQIIIFYKEKRDEAKYIVDRNKIKGSSTSIEKGIFEKIYNYIFSTEQQPQYTLLNLSLSSIVTEMKIDIEEFVDVYGNYFDLPRTNTSTVTLRDIEYSSNINDIDVNLFFKEVLPKDIFGSQSFLLEIPLAVNYAVSVDPICDPTNPLNFINADNKCGISQDERDALKRELISKYIGVDFYYITTVDGVYSSGRFITAQNPTSNIPNLQAADTATVESNEVKLLRDIGLFFKPDTIGLFQLNSSNYTYSVDATKLEADKVYIFPDPNVYGNVSVNRQPNYPLIFVHDYTKDVKNSSSGFASGDPKINNYEQTFTPYYTRQQNVEKNIVSEDSLNLNFSDLYNKGFITKVQYDIYGNEYALFKNEFGQTFKSVESIESSSIILDLTLDGYSFFDSLEGYNFDYSTVGTIDGSIRSGLSTLTVNDVVTPFTTPQFTLSGFPYTLFFREFTPYQESSTPVRNVVYSYKDAGSFTFLNNTPLPDPLFADSISPAYPSSSQYYYNELVDAGISQFTPYIQRGYISGGTSFSNFTLDAKYILSSEQSGLTVDNFDCGYFTDDTSQLTNDYSYGYDYVYHNSVSPDSLTVISSLTGDNTLITQNYKRKLNGNLFIKNQRYSNSTTLSSALSSIFTKYNTSVRNEVYGGIKDFDVIYDTIICETDSYLVFDKINYTDGAFKTPGTKNTYFTRSSSTSINKFSNRFFDEKEKTITFCSINQLVDNSGAYLTSETGLESITTETPPLFPVELQVEFDCLSGTNSNVIIPAIYQYNITDNTVTQVFPRLDDITQSSIQLFSLRNYISNSFDINIVKIDKPVIAYNSFNRIYKLTYTCTDNNNMVYVYDYGFSINNNLVVFHDARFYKTDKVVNTTGFYSTSINYATTGAIQGTPTVQDGTFIL
jgi:hypothetical protein